MKKEELEEQACQCEGPCESDACCEEQAEAQAEEAQAPQKATIEEVAAKFEELQELVERCDKRVITFCVFDFEEMVSIRSSVSKCALESDGKDSTALSWSAALGYFKKANACFTNNPEAIGTGVRYMMEH